MDYSIIFALSMLGVGLALIVAELFIPSGGVITLLSVICLGVSIYSAHDAWWAEHPQRFWWFIASIVGLIPATAGLTLTILSRTRLGNRVFLEAPKLEEVTPYIHETEERKQLIGKQGKTLTLMAPGGLVLVEGKRLHAETEGQMLDPEQPIRVMGIKANRVVVRLDESPQTEKPAGKNGSHSEPLPAQSGQKESSERPKLAEASGEANSAPLDFEIPEG